MRVGSWWADDPRWKTFTNSGPSPRSADAAVRPVKAAVHDPRSISILAMTGSRTKRPFKSLVEVSAFEKRTFLV
jgi:hypothetical protein